MYKKKNYSLIVLVIALNNNNLYKENSDRLINDNSKKDYR